MRRKRRNFSPEFKLKVILETLKERETLTALSKRFDLHPNQISKWKLDFLENAKSCMSPRQATDEKEKDEQVEKLYVKIGKLQMENDFLKKKLL